MRKTTLVIISIWALSLVLTIGTILFLLADKQAGLPNINWSRDSTSTERKLPDVKHVCVSIHSDIDQYGYYPNGNINITIDPDLTENRFCLPAAAAPHVTSEIVKDTLYIRLQLPEAKGERQPGLVLRLNTGNWELRLKEPLLSLHQLSETDYSKRNDISLSYHCALPVESLIVENLNSATLIRLHIGATKTLYNMSNHSYAVTLEETNDPHIGALYTEYMVDMENCIVNDVYLNCHSNRSLNFPKSDCTIHWIEALPE